MNDELIYLVKTNAHLFGLEPALVASVVQQESNWEPLAMRYEPMYRWLWPSPEAVVAPSGVSLITERMQQKTSWGLMQVMGAVAREHGFQGRFLGALLDPDDGLHYGCRHLKGHIQRWGSVEDGVSAYNAGRPTATNKEHYTDKVMGRIESLRGLFL